MAEVCTLEVLLLNTASCSTKLTNVTIKLTDVFTIKFICIVKNMRQLKSVYTQLIQYGHVQSILKLDKVMKKKSKFNHKMRKLCPFEQKHSVLYAGNTY